MYTLLSSVRFKLFHCKQHTVYQNISRSFKLRMISFKTIGTHNGVFHCDEVLGCFMLKLLSPEATITRSRDKEVLSKCDIVIDVGGEYNPETLRFDHHQKEFNHTMNSLNPSKPWKIKLSSAGLVYCHYGKDILQAILGKLDQSLLDVLYDRIYESFIQEVDGIDNGIPMFDGEPAYRINTNLSSRVSYLNQNWNQTDYDEVAAFDNAMKLAGNEFVESVKYMANVWWPARSIVYNAIDNRFKVHGSGEVVELENFCPWESHLFDLEEEMGIDPGLKFLIFVDRNGTYRVRAIPVARGSFVLRVPLKSEWRGLDGCKLSELSGIKDCIFVHSSGFIGGNKTKEGAIEMAVKTLQK